MEMHLLLHYSRSWKNLQREIISGKGRRDYKIGG
jgi:hypothetical protein